MAKKSAKSKRKTAKKPAAASAAKEITRGRGRPRKYGGGPMKKTSVQISDEMSGWLDGYIARKEISRNDAMMRALEMLRFADSDHTSAIAR